MATTHPATHCPATPLRLLPAALAAALACWLALATPALAQDVYRCPGAGGQVVFQQWPCAGGQAGAHRVQVPAPNVVEGNPAGEANLRAEAMRAFNARVAVARGHVVEGMTDAELRRSWGEPRRINVTQTPAGTTVQYVYRLGDGSTRYVYTQDGRVVAVQHHLRR